MSYGMGYASEFFMEFLFIKSPQEVYRRTLEDEEDEPWAQFERRFTVINLKKRTLTAV